MRRSKLHATDLRDGTETVVDLPGRATFHLIGIIASRELLRAETGACTDVIGGRE